MASGFVTSDGKDLDSRYLAIGGKAASASKADTAMTATNVTNKGTVKRGSIIRFSASSSAPYTAAAPGLVVMTGGQCSVNSAPVHGNNANCSDSGYVNKGDKVYGSTSTAYPGLLYSVSIG